ncbi:uncharacterized protein [Nicotiana sylvestris]|uniref:Uncharacterized protein isoform X1 n=2 Tax=Nicotiana TaxID=4085 RepID=A0A1S4DSQ2_TOBAC|nr:PREDICTED: uncharacterized protein LOC104233294 isoform X1 [Nicotiana sylvestris]XP_016516174.1 PREDICTED: uncharacterized protein LOC107832808 isoform X1 [Nicotiana tabacum]
MCPFHLLLNHVFFIPAAREILVFPHSLCILSTNAPSSISVLFIFFVHFHLLNRCCNFRVIILLWKLRVKNFSKIVAETILDFHSEHSIQVLKKISSHCGFGMAKISCYTADYLLLRTNSLCL